MVSFVVVRINNGSRRAYSRDGVGYEYGFVGEWHKRNGLV